MNRMLGVVSSSALWQRNIVQFVNYPQLMDTAEGAHNEQTDQATTVLFIKDSFANYRPSAFAYSLNNINGN